MLDWFQALPPTWQALVFITVLFSPKTGEAVLRHAFGLGKSEDAKAAAAKIEKRIKAVEDELVLLRPVVAAARREQEQRQEEERIRAVAALVATRLQEGQSGGA